MKYCSENNEHGAALGWSQWRALKAAPESLFPAQQKNI
jgi:hypothetical protein